MFKYILCITRWLRFEVPVPFKVKAVKKRKPIRITIPKQIVDYLKIKESDSLEITVQNSEIIVQKEKKE